MKVLVACEFSGTVREAFKKAGHDAWSCDLEDTDILGQHIKGDVLNVLNLGWDMMIAHPPCTYLTCTGNIWFKEEWKNKFPNRQQQRDDAVAFFLALANAPIERICIENPIGIMSTKYKKPSQMISPWQFGHEVAKKTCLWLKNLPPLVHTNVVGKGEYVTFKSGRRLPKWFSDAANLSEKERARVRNKTFQGIADAMASQWGSLK